MMTRKMWIRSQRSRYCRRVGRWALIAHWARKPTISSIGTERQLGSCQSKQLMIFLGNTIRNLGAYMPP